MHLARITAEFATAWWHWFFFAQPNTPERVIGADPDSWYTGDPERMGQENYAGRRLTCPTLVLWSEYDDMEELYGDPTRIWADWAEDVRGHRIASGHHMAEDAPDELVARLAEFFGQG